MLQMLQVLLLLFILVLVLVYYNSSQCYASAAADNDVLAPCAKNYNEDYEDYDDN